jgi:hypothetical protein
MTNPIFQGNHHAGYKGHGITGTGNERLTVEMGWGTVAGKSGDVAYIQLSSLVTGDINMGVYFQSEVPVTIDYTLCNPGIAISPDPDDQAATLWTGAQAVPGDGTIVTAAHPVFTVIRVTFGGDGSLYVGVR